MPTLVTTIQVNELGYSSSAQASAAAAAASAASAASAATTAAQAEIDAFRAASEFVLSGSSPYVINLPDAADALAWDVFFEGVHIATNAAQVLIEFGDHQKTRVFFEVESGATVQTENGTDGEGVSLNWGRQALIPSVLPAGQRKGYISFRVPNRAFVGSIPFGGCQTFDPDGADPEAVLGDSGANLGFNYLKAYFAPRNGTFDGTITLTPSAGNLAGTVYVKPVYRV